MHIERDSNHARSYIQYNIFLPGINNEGAAKNSTYKDRLLKINKVVLVKFLNDTIVVPRDRSALCLPTTRHPVRNLFCPSLGIFIIHLLGRNTWSHLSVNSPLPRTL